MLVARKKYCAIVYNLFILFDFDKDIGCYVSVMHHSVPRFQLIGEKTSIRENLRRGCKRVCILSHSFGPR